MSTHQQQSDRRYSTIGRDYRPIKWLMLWLIGVYRLLISPVLGLNCRFFPSCSEYARAAISRFGVIRGSLLALKRVSCCHPWHRGGFDPVPECCTLDHNEGKHIE